MAHDKHNLIRDMVDFDVRLRASEVKEGQYHVEAELRAAEAEIFDEDTGIALKVSARRIVLRFEMEGLEVAPGARHHDDLRVSGPTRKTTDKTEIRTSGTASASIAGKAGIGGASAGADAEMKAEASVAASRTVEATTENAERFVVARPGDRWEIMEGGNRPLKATYLTSDTPLCVVRSVRGANRLSLTATVEVLERDLKIDFLLAKSLYGRASATRRKLTEIVVAKAIAQSLGESYSGKLVISKVETDIEG